MTAAHKLLRKLKKLGGTPVARPETFLVKGEEVEEGTEADLLFEGELERAGPWAAALLGCRREHQEE
jgi:bacterioferritin (cytochrome b1)